MPFLLTNPKRGEICRKMESKNRESGATKCARKTDCRFVSVKDEKLDGARRLRCPAEIYRKRDESRNATYKNRGLLIRSDKTRELETVPSTSSNRAPFIRASTVNFQLIFGISLMALARKEKAAAAASATAGCLRREHQNRSCNTLSRPTSGWQLLF
jgi:hypothetical protein